MVFFWTIWGVILDAVGEKESFWGRRTRFCSLERVATPKHDSILAFSGGAPETVGRDRVWILVESDRGRPTRDWLEGRGTGAGCYCDMSGAGSGFFCVLLVLLRTNLDFLDLTGQLGKAL